MKGFSINIPQHDPTVAFSDGNKILFALEEERHTRVKSYKDYHENMVRFPREVSTYLNSKIILNDDTVDYVATCNDGMPDFLKTQYGIEISENKFFKVDHHEAHAASAYYWSNFQDDALVLVLDGGADNGVTGRWYLGESGNLTEIGNLPETHISFGHYYTLLTEFLGFKRSKDEGKIVGMSSHGQFDSFLYEFFNGFLKLDTETLLTPNFDLHSFANMLYGGWFSRFGGHYWKNDINQIAYNAQLVFEDRIVDLINGIKEKYPEIKKVALAGGVFANIKVNKRINEVDWVEEVFVAPPMGDEGLSVGCLLVAQKKLEIIDKPYEIENVFLGSQLEKAELYNFDEDKFETFDYKVAEVAEQIAYGKIVGFIQGKYEHGPRALGSRSILAHPGLDKTYKRVNDRLQRNDFMPFAPSVLSEMVDVVFDCKKSKYTSEFMTMLFDTKLEWQNRIPAVVHPVDKTARAQIVVKEKNPKFWEIINEFYQLTDIPLLLNTSFNTHGEPIIRTLQDGLNHLENGIIDILVAENKIFIKK